jgi:peptidyl-tRNA hydrolase
MLSLNEVKNLMDKLYIRKQDMKNYLLSKFESEDWHAVQDAASDIRDIESEIIAYQKVSNE